MTTTQNTKVDQSIVDKINKLLALSESPNEHESAAAAAKVSALLMQHNLSLSDIGDAPEEAFDRYTVEETKICVTWKMTLLQGIAKANGCEAFFNPGKVKALILVGYPTSCIIVHNLYDYLSATIERLAAEHKGQGRSFLNAFKVGCAMRLRDRLAEQRRKMESSGIPGTQDSAPTSAIVVKSMFQKTDQLLKNYLAPLKISQTKVNSVRDKSGFETGYETADQISLNNQIKQSDKSYHLSGV